MALEIVLVLVLILLNGFFAMSELAIVSARRARLQQRAQAGSPGARVALQLSDDPTRFLSTVQIGITLIGLLAGAFSGATIAESFAADFAAWGLSERAANLSALVLVVLVLTFLSLVIGELVPKRVALAHADAIAARVAPTINTLARLTHPAVAVLRWTTEAAASLLGVGSSQRTAVTDEEINALIAEGTQQGIIHPAERAMVEEVLRLADRPVRTIMTHRTDIVWLDVNDTAEVLRQKLAEGGYSRFPVCEGDLDHCIGYVRMRDIADRLLADQPVELPALVREPLTVGETLKALDLMAMFRRARPHVALVVDEYGSLLGIVTPTDVLETITGDFSGSDGPSDQQLVRREDGSWLADAQIELHDLERKVGGGGLAMGTQFSTLAGLILSQLGRIPQPGEVLIVNRWRIEVVDLDGQRIDKVVLTPLGTRTRV
ncbi:MAG TPA: hemolysin family protein [Gammaproteobacteria bacterium]|nr:hemolysin family protein [Gammaproteobacteria bacterium]